MSNSNGKPSYILKRNKYGNYEHPETSFVFDKNTQEAYGKQTESCVEPLTGEDIKLCKIMKFKYRDILQSLDGKSSSQSSKDEIHTLEEAMNILNTPSSSKDEIEICDSEENNDDSDGEDSDDEDEIEEEILKQKRDESLMLLHDHQCIKKKEEDKKKGEQTIGEIEGKYRELLTNIFVKRWEIKFEEEEKKNLSCTHKISFDIYNSNIKNIHGLEFLGYEISYYKMTKQYYIEFNTHKFVDGIIKNDLESSVFTIQYNGTTIKEAFIKAMDNLNRFVFCRHCGIIRKDNIYDLNEQKCECCIINDILACESKTSEYCAICMENTKNYYTLRCGHKFHRSCVSNLNHKICPLCRTHINICDEENDYNDHSNYDDEDNEY
jgi:hypothetical protein